MKVKIAGLCFKILTDNYSKREKGVLFNYIDSQYGFFISDNKENFVIRFKKNRHSSRKATGFSVEPYKNNDDIKVIKRNNRFFVLDSYSSDNIGFIDVANSICEFNDHGNDTLQILGIPFFRLCLQFFLAKYKGFLVHACGVIYKGKGYLFPGRAGSGKTTIANMSKNLLVFSDESICIRYVNNSYIMYGVPWHNDQNTHGKLGYILFPVKSKNVSFKKIKPSTSACYIYDNIYYNIPDSTNATNTLETITEMVQTVPCYKMKFSLRDPLWEKIGNMSNDT